MIQFSANLGFLWTDRSLPDGIRAAADAGFDAVECHWPYETPSCEVKEALQESNLRMLGINTRRGDVARGENGVAALPGRETEARQYIDQSISYAVDIDCKNIHVMAGIVENQKKEARDTFTANLQYACNVAAEYDKNILIEPLNHIDVPGYFISTLEQALTILERVDALNLKIMFDCYHMQIMGGNLLSRYKSASEHIGHIQFAGVPKRNEPDSGEVNYPWLLNEILAIGYKGVFGAEYKPSTTTENSLNWMSLF